MTTKPATARAGLGRSSGILLHPTSFPGDYGIGSLSSAAIRWLDWLQSARQKLWQILPLGHTSYGDSPYQSFSAFAGNPLLISLEDLASDGLLDEQVLVHAPDFPRDAVDYGWIYVWKWQALRSAFARFRDAASSAQKAEFEDFRARNAAWLEDYALFMALKDRFEGAPWNAWPQEFRQREAAALEAARGELAEGIGLYEFAQWAFWRQWKVVRDAAHERGIRIIGDLPIFVALDSSDVWANPGLFTLREDGQPESVAGVPPDYFSATGQLWGNPLYRWDLMRQDGYAWWMDRFRATFDAVDVVRVDHFRGFESYWQVPGDAQTAIHGLWVKGPGAEFLAAVQKAFPDGKIIAEDLGIITPEVEELRDEFGLPGMKVLQFAFDADADHPYLPHTYNRNAVVYTGTHDNDTTRGWFESSPPERQDAVRRYVESSDEDVTWKLIEAAWMSRADVAVIPLQDVLDLGSLARMNTPGTLGGRNWGWRYSDADLTPEAAERLAALTAKAGR
ncbi:MAG TPA: 4-alpha-glucanotransferase [Deinococcales bacterium]|nr:4-alpha-glucanotransferase [Deinococcales bacterium]